MLRNRYFNCSSARRMHPFALENKLTFCWAVKEADLALLYDEYYDVSWQLVRPSLKSRIWAVNHADQDAYICGRSSIAPDFVRFNPGTHCISFVNRDGLDFMGNPMPVIDVLTTWEVAFEGSPVWRRNKPTTLDKALGKMVLKRERYS